MNAIVLVEVPPGIVLTLNLFTIPTLEVTGVKNIPCNFSFLSYGLPNNIRHGMWILENSLLKWDRQLERFNIVNEKQWINDKGNCANY